MRVVVVAALAFAAGAHAVAQEPPPSPRIAALVRAVRGDAPGAMERFWRAMEMEGGPLVEPHPSDSGRRLVTFVWRQREPTNEVVVAGAALGSDPVRNRLERLDGTDLWFRTLDLPADLRTVYRFALDPPHGTTGNRTHARRDPLNPRTFVYARDPDDAAGADYRVSLLELPGAAPQPWVEASAGVARGTVDTHRFASASLRNTRRVFAYTPAGYGGSDTRLPLLIVFDGATYLRTVPTPTVLDNLIAAGAIPPLVAILVDNPDAATRNRELDCYPPFVDFMAREMLPWIRRQYRVTDDPAQRVLAGSSGGGQASMCIAQHHPELFGKVLAQSGSFFESPDRPIGDEWAYRHLITGPSLPLAFYLDVGRFEPVFSVTGVRMMRNVLEALRYSVTYVEYSGGHDYAWWRGTLADGLIALLGRP